MILAACDKQKLKSKCEHGGYQDPIYCEQCRCLDGWGGQFCQLVAKPGKYTYLQTFFF